MSQDALVTLDLEGYLAFYGLLAVIILALFWFLQREDRLVREKFLNQFEDSQLRMSPYKLGMVYRVVETGEGSVSVVPIWDGKKIIPDGAVRQLNSDQLIPFDKARFS